MRRQSHQEANAPAGYGLQRLLDPRALCGLSDLALYLPLQLVELLREEREAQAVRDAEQEEAARIEAAFLNPPSAASATVSPLKSRPLDPATERALVQVLQPGEHFDPQLQHRVFDAYAPVDMLDASRRASDRREQERQETIFRELKARGCLRRIGWPADADVDLDALALAHPHFAHVVGFVRQRLKLARASNTPPRIPPLLLCGEPGVGKTHFCHALARTLGTTVRRQPFDNADSTSVLTGTDRHWGNTHTGVLFDLLALGEHANPVIVLDELDKARTRASGLDPLAPLHSLLEPATASQVRDVSLEFVLDASLVTWIGTANDITALPQSLLSRFRVFGIRLPTGQEAIQVAQGVMDDVLGRLLPSNGPVPRRLATQVAHLVAREVYQATEAAAAAAVAAGRSRLVASDLPDWAVCLEPTAQTCSKTLH